MAKLTISIGAKISALKKGLSNASNRVKTWSRKVSGFTKAAFGAAFAGVGVGIGAIIRKSAGLAAQFEQIKVAFTTMTGSAARAKELIAELNEFSKATPFSPEQVTKAARTLLAFGFAAKDVKGTLKLLGDVSAGTGKDLSEMAVIFGQIKGAGRLMGGDLLQLINAGFNPLQVISEKTGKSMKQLKEEMSKGLITFDQVQQAFKDATSEGGIFFNMMEKQSQTLNGQLSTLEGNVNDLLRQFGELALPELKLVVSGLGEAVQGLQELAAARAALESGDVATESGLGADIAANAYINGLEMATQFFLPFDKQTGDMFDKLRAKMMEAGEIGAAAATKAEIKAGRKERVEKIAAEKAAKEEAEKAEQAKKDAEVKKVSQLGLDGDADFASADPVGDFFAEQRKQFDKLMDARAVRVDEATKKKQAEDLEKKQAAARQAIQDAFKPGSVIQSRLARIGGERAITTDPTQAQLLNVAQQNLKANQKIAMALEDYEGPTFPSR